VPLFVGFGNTDRLANSNSLVAKAQAEDQMQNELDEK
jgi:hypothetical protein